MVGADQGTLELLTVSMSPGVGPVLSRRLVESLGSAGEVLRAPAERLTRVEGVGAGRAGKIVAGRAEAARRAERELARLEAVGARLVVLGGEGYPRLLAELPDAPLLLSVRGSAGALESEFRVALVGSRRASSYGIEQAERFAGGLASQGLTVVSGGARGIDTAAHRAALRVRGRTVVVLGCGLGKCYPPENAELYEEVVAGGGALVSELAVDTPPSVDTFPARNRIISGLSLGVVVVEAPRSSGALITARYAGESHGREVMAVPGRVDSAGSEGAHGLIREGAAALVSSPGDVLETLEPRAWHAARGTTGAFVPGVGVGAAGRDGVAGRGGGGGGEGFVAPGWLDETQRRIVEALDEPRGIDELCRATGLAASTVSAQATLLEVRRVLVRQGGRLARNCGGG